ncbi:MAG: hypothetical protein ACYDH9_08025 [Limisphaerales bacterium]
MTLEFGEKLASRIAAELQPLCERIEVAGSIRRRRTNVNDIDLVILPKPGKLPAIKTRCSERCAAVIDGPQNTIFRLALPNGGDVQIDLFFARPAIKDLFQEIPSNFGAILLCRTGSKEHNIYLVEHAKKIGLKLNPYGGVFDEEGYCLAAATEEEIFTALNLDFIPPESRDR